jgi:hypothetical protein
MKLDNRDTMVTWFCQNYKPLVDGMKEISHFPSHRTNHPFHGEGPVWTHVLMVMTHIQCDETLSSTNKQVLLTVGLLHDIGKVSAHQVKDDGEKYSFEGHEGLSFFKALDILDHMEKEDDFYSNFMKLTIARMVSLHGTGIIFDEGSTDYYLAHRFRKADKEGAIRNIDENIFAQYPKRKISSRAKVEKDKHVILMCGLPGSGKTTVVGEYNGYYIVSRDNYMEKYYYLYNEKGLETSNDIYHWIYSEENLPNFNMDFDRYLNKVAKEQDKVIVDMTLLTAGKRRNMLNRFSKFNATCVCLLTGEKEFHRINDQRELEGSGLSKERFRELKKKFIFPIEAEGFEQIHVRTR